jgi:hypothetical protein
VNPEDVLEPKAEAEGASDASPKNTAAKAAVSEAPVAGNTKTTPESMARIGDGPKVGAQVKSSDERDRSSVPISAAPAKAKHIAATPETGNVQPETKPVVEAGPGAAAPVAAVVQGNVQTDDGAAAVKVAMAAATQVSAKPASPDAKRPAAIGETEKSAAAQTVQLAGEDVASVAKDSKAPAATARLREQAIAGLGEFAGHANAENTPTLQAGLQMSSTGAIIAPQTLAPNHGATLSPLAATPTTATATTEGGALNGHQILAAAPSQLDVGVFDSTHGWLRIRAELGAGGDVSASLTASATAHGALRAAVPEMSSYLAAESVSVSKIAVHRAAEGSVGMGLAPGGSGQNGAASGDRQPGQRMPGGTGTWRRDSVSSNEPGTAAGASGPNVWTRATSLPMPWVGTAFGSGVGSGSWLKLRA